MSTETAPSRSTGVPLTLALLSLTVVVFFFSQIGAVRQQAKALAWQIGINDTQITNAKTNEEEAKKAIANQTKVAEQADGLQIEYQKIFEELLELAKDDPDAQSIIDKYKIQKNAPPKEAEKPADKKP